MASPASGPTVLTLYKLIKSLKLKGKKCNCLIKPLAFKQLPENNPQNSFNCFPYILLSIIFSISCAFPRFVPWHLPPTNIAMLITQPSCGHASSESHWGQKELLPRIAPSKTDLNFTLWNVTAALCEKDISGQLLFPCNKCALVILDSVCDIIWG